MTLECKGTSPKPQTVIFFKKTLITLSHGQNTTTWNSMKTSSSCYPTTPTKQKRTLSAQTYSKHLQSCLSISPQSTRQQTPNNSIIKAKSLVRDLGVQLSSDYSWTPHINIMVDAARRTTSWVLSVFSDRSPETMMTLYKSLIRSRLEYCCPLWNPHLIRDIQQIESAKEPSHQRFKAAAT